MIRNYFLLAIRGMRRDVAHSVINITGLSVGVACCLLLALYIRDETSYDKHHHHLSDLYMVTTTIGEETENNVMYTSSPPIVWGIKDELPEIDNVTRLVNPPGVSQNLIRYHDKSFYESDGLIADSTLFDMFAYKFAAGNRKTALAEPNSVVLTAALAEKLFGDSPALNQIISINQGGSEGDFRVTGVLAPAQGKSHIKANFFVSMTSAGWAEYIRSPRVADQWAGQNFMQSYIRLKPGHSPQDFIPKMNRIFLQHGAEDLKTLGMKKKLGLQLVKDLYLHAARGEASPRITYLYVIGSIALFILLIACINFMNLSTARATRRATEVGLRKTMGAARATLIGQFLGEAMVIVAVSIAMSVLLAQLLLPLFNTLTMKEISLTADSVGFLSLVLVAITVVTGLLAGGYPAFYLSAFQPARALKGKEALNNSGNVLRRSLVVFQFTIAIALVCAVVMVSRQLRFMQSKDLGFNAGNKLVVPLRSDAARANHAGFRTEIEKMSTVMATTGSSYVPGLPVWNDFSLYPEGGSMDASVNIKNIWVEPNYMEMMGIKLVAGRRFTANRESESLNKIILNETAVKRLGYTPAEIVGKRLYNDSSTGRESYDVIGVMQDYHQVTPKEAIYPLLFRVPSEQTHHDYIIAGITGEHFPETIAQIGAIWKNINPDTPFEYTFLDQDIKKQYDDDKRVSQVIGSFTAIAMIICCLGLYGLSTFMAERRFKEIGVRKVLGATVGQIVQMMSGEFLRLVLIAFALAVPIAWYALGQWLDNFAYKAPVDITVFIFAGAAALLIALLTVSFESIRAATGNPVNALRNE